MSATGESEDRDPVEALVDEFLRGHRRGDATTIEQFAAAHTEHAAVLRDLLPTLVALERVKRDRATTSGFGTLRTSVPAMERLGDFRIVREIGRGGMGVVFEAMQESLGRRVALKVLPQASLLTGSQLERFRREAQIASQLHHSNIVPVFGSGETDGYHWYAMQFIAGQSLDQWRQAQAAQPPNSSAAWQDRSRLVAVIGQQAASALHYAHGQGTLHRDVKPANLLIENDEHVWVTDFGLAKALEAEGLTHSGDLLGTLQYMAPEQFAGHYDVRSEVYALGITLYELLVLRPAFAAKTRSELMELIRTQPPHALRRASPAVPEDLACVVERAMARDPADRYPDAAAFAADLEAFLADRPIAARRHTTLQLVWRWGRRNRALATLAASTLLAVVGAAVTGWVAYVATDEALGQATAATARANAATAEAQQKSRLLADNLALTVDAFAEVFDALVGRDPVLALEEDPDTGEQATVARTVEPRDVALLDRMLAYYDRFAAANESSQSLRLETARAYRRVGAIQTRLGNLDEAAAGYDKALARYLELTNRDVTRELADLQLAYGQLEQRRRRGAEAEQRFRRAKELLGPDRDEDPRSLRFQRAEAHFLLADTLLIGNEPGRRPPFDRGRDPVRGRDGRGELAAARQILGSLLQQEPTNPEFLALQGRSLLVGGRSRGGQGPGERDTERDAERKEGIAIFQKLVREHPHADQYAVELCNALLSDRRPGAPGAPRNDEEAAAELLRLREAQQLAAGLLARQPEFTDYQALRIRCGAALGRTLVRRAAAGDPAATSPYRTEAEPELRTALALAESLLGRGAPVDGQVLVDHVSARSALATLLADTGRLDEARDEATKIVAQLRRVSDQRRRGRPPAVRTELWNDVESVLRRSGSGELLQELIDLREKLQPGDRPERGAAPPPRRR